MTDNRSDFARAHQWERASGGRWNGEITEGWLQGRGAFGGLQAAVAMRAMQSLVDPERVPRTLTMHLAAPLLPGPASFEAQVERAGGSISHTSGRIVQEGAPIALALATFGRPREHAFSAPGDPMPSFRPPRSFRMPQGPAVPAFTRYVDLDMIDGFPFSGADEPRVKGWTRFLGDDPIDAPMLVAIGDVWPPAAIAVTKLPKPASTVDLTYQFITPPPLDDLPRDSFFAFEAHTPSGRDGYTEERGSVWAPDGRLLLRVRQLRAVY